MTDLCKHDDLLINVLKEEGHILPFLDAIFGFLYRRTDFYIVQDNPDGKLGFPVGVAETVVADTFKKWQKLARNPVHTNSIPSMEDDLTGLVIHEEEVETSENADLPELPTEQCDQKKHNSVEDLASDTYNGADCGAYRWSQTITDVDIKVPVANNVTKSANVRVDIQACHMTVDVREAEGHWHTVMHGQLAFKHRKDESIWTLSPGRQVIILLEKAGEKWWDRLLTTEAALDMAQINTSRHVTELPPEDQMQVEKVMVQQERKRRGDMSQAYKDQLNMMKQAWNAEGSPFIGEPFDPSVLQLHPS